jgi:hypothetical protein
MLTTAYGFTHSIIPHSFLPGSFNSETLTLLLNIRLIADLISVATRMHPAKCSSVRRVVVFDLTCFIKLSCCLQQQAQSERELRKKKEKKESSPCGVQKKKKDGEPCI